MRPGAGRDNGSSSLQRRLSIVPRGLPALVLVVELLVLACLGMLIWKVLPRAGGTGPGGSSNTAAELRAVARDLEDKGLEAEAASTWDACLAAEPDAGDRAEILYRIGKLRMQAQQYGAAAAALVRAERAAGTNTELKAKIGPLVVECLGRLGRYGEVGRELARRVEISQADQKVQPRAVATLSGQQLTEADLDRLAERRVDNLLAMQGAAGDQERRKAMLQQLATPEARKQLLQELLQTELFCRRARELKLDQEDGFRQARDQLVQGLLAQQFLTKELAKIQPTEIDLESYYKANLADYKQAESLQVITIQLKPDEDPAALLGKIKSADEFLKIATERQGANASGSAGVTPRRVSRNQEDPLLGNSEQLFSLSEGQWTKTAIAHGHQRNLVLVQKKQPARTPTLEEITPRVRADYVARKQQELGESLLHDLMTRYDVRIVPPEEQKSPPAKTEKTSQ